MHGRDVQLGLETFVLRSIMSESVETVHHSIFGMSVSKTENREKRDLSAKCTEILLFDP